MPAPEGTGTSWKPNWVVHPGEILQEVLEDFKLTPRLAARVTGIPETDLVALLEGQASITPEIAERLTRFPVPASLWLNLQRIYDAGVAKQGRPPSE